MKPIRQVWLFLLCTALTASASSAQKAPPTLAGRTFLALPGDSWKLIFDDEFTGDHLDRSKWSIGLAWTGDDGTNRHHNSMYASYIADNDIAVHDGLLDLLTRRADTTGKNGKVYHYTEGFIQTDGKFSYQYGYCEIRAKAPAGEGRGLWPAFWLQDHGWPPEDDVAEFWTGRPQPHFHQGYAFRNGDGNVQWNSRHWESIPYGWHTYGMEWGPGYQLMNMDGRITKAIYGPQVTSRSMYLMLNSGVASNPAPTDATVFPNSFLVDYVRVYSRPPVVPLHDGDFSYDSLDPWWTTTGAAHLATVAGQRVLQLDAANSSFSQRIYGLAHNTTYEISAQVCPSGGTVKLGATDFAQSDQWSQQTGPGFRTIDVRFTTTRFVSSASLVGSKTTGENPAYFSEIRIRRISP